MGIAQLSTAMLFTLARTVQRRRTTNEVSYEPRHQLRGPAAETTRPLPVRGVAHVPPPKFVRPGSNSGRHAAR